jgi:hypothetical protein
MESVRKDVECFFVILKGRFRILNNGLQLHTESAVKNAFKSCAIFHNKILEYDSGYAQQTQLWENADWTTLDDIEDPTYEIIRNVLNISVANEIYERSLFAPFITNNPPTVVNNEADNMERIIIKANSCSDHYKLKDNMLVTSFNKQLEANQYIGLKVSSSGSVNAFLLKEYKKNTKRNTK